MIANFGRRPIAQQLMLVTMVALIVVFGAMAFIVQKQADRAALNVAEQNLQNEANIMAGLLDSLFQGVKQRGERQSQFFVKHMGSLPVLGSEQVRTGDVDLPMVRLAGEVLNANSRWLLSFKDLTGDESAFLVVKNDKVYRLSTLLKDKEGKSTNGTSLGDNDPVAKSVLAGSDYSGLAVRNGKYFFSTVKVLKGADGKAWGAYSIRISLEDELKRMRDQFGGLVAGKTGYVFIVRPTDEKGIGEFVLHPKFQEKIIGELGLPSVVTDSIREMLQKKRGAFRYDLPDETGSLREKVVFAATSENWGWTVATGSWIDEYLDESIRLRNVVLWVSLASAILLCLLIGVLVRSRIQGLTDLVTNVSKISAGDLRASAHGADANSRNEIHEIAHAFNVMSESVRGLVRGVSATSARVDAAAGELQGAAKLAMESSQQASASASGIAASVEEMSVSISLVAEHADEAARISDEAKGVTESGRQVVGRAMTELERVAGEINESAVLIESLGERSKQISSVVGVIREIAEQTNLLALNAAIEAARAGEQGRGFAVVADEVRKLAERTALSTQEISTTVQAILQETGNAVQRMQSVSANMTQSVGLAHDAGVALATIDERAHQTVEVVQSIADSTREQSSASQEIARLVENIAQMAEGSSTRAVKNTERAENLRTLAAELQSQLSRFTT